MGNNPAWKALRLHVRQITGLDHLANSARGDTELSVRRTITAFLRLCTNAEREASLKEFAVHWHARDGFTEPLRDSILHPEDRKLSIWWDYGERK